MATGCAIKEGISEEVNDTVSFTQLRGEILVIAYLIGLVGPETDNEEEEKLSGEAIRPRGSATRHAGERRLNCMPTEEGRGVSKACGLLSRQHLTIRTEGVVEGGLSTQILLVGEVKEATGDRAIEAVSSNAHATLVTECVGIRVGGGAGGGRNGDGINMGVASFSSTLAFKEGTRAGLTMDIVCICAVSKPACIFGPLVLVELGL